VPERRKVAIRGLGLRLATGLALAAFAVVLVALAPLWGIVLTVAVLAALGVFEYSRMALPKGPRLEEAVCVACAALVPLAALKGPATLMAALMLAFMVAVCVTWLAQAELHLLMQRLLVRGWGLVYVCGLLSCLLLLAIRPHGRVLLLFLIFSVVAADTGAYLSGHALGRHQLASRLSPNKTWEGLVGGLLLAGLTGFTFAGLWLPDTRAWLGAGLGVALGLVSVAGDLLESSLKRAGGVKDSGFILPGHGGILDRLDGILGAAPLLLLVRELWW
jgi:phosphatidate cytidylyltransferase